MIQYDYNVAADGSIEEDVPYPLSWEDNVVPLADSITRAGLTSPIVLWPLDGKLFLLCGRRRRLALRLLGIKEFPALTITQALLPLEAFRLALEDNLHRGFNDTEKALAVKHMARLAPREQVRSELLPLLNIPPTEEFLERYLALAGLGTKGLDLVAQGLLDPQTGRTVADMTVEDRDAILDLLAELKPGVNKRRQILELIQDIARRENTGPAAIVNAPDIREILADPNLNTPQKEQRTRDTLIRRRFPKRTAMQDRQQYLLKKLAVGKGLQLKTPPGFEGMKFQMEITFSDPDELAEAIRELERIARDPALAELIELG